MPRVTGLDGRVFEVSAETLEKCRIPDEQVRSLDVSFDLPEAPPILEAPPFPDDGPPPSVVASHPWVKVREGEGGGFVIEITPPAASPSPPGDDPR